MGNFIQKHIATLVLLIGYALSLGIIYASMRADDTAAKLAQSELQKRVEKLEDQRANETRLIVDSHGKRLDKHDEVLARLQDQTNQILVTLGRIEAKLEQRGKP